MSNPSDDEFYEDITLDHDTPADLIELHELMELDGQLDGRETEG